MHIPSEVTSDIDELAKTSTPTLDKNHVHEESISHSVQDALIESSTPIPDDISISEDDTSNSEHILVESSMSVQVTRYSLVIPMIKNGTEHETVDTSIVIQ